MSAEVQKEIRLEIAHILFIDIVGYSKHSINEQRASIDDWIATLAAVPNDLEAPALRVEPVIGEVLSALRAANGTLLARMSGSGATCFAIFGNEGDARRASQDIQLEHPQWWLHAGTLS